MDADAAELTYIDARANGLKSVPDSLAELPLEKLDLRWNPIESFPSWLDGLEARGCTVSVTGSGLGSLKTTTSANRRTSNNN